MSFFKRAAIAAGGETALLTIGGTIASIGANLYMVHKNILEREEFEEMCVKMKEEHDIRLKQMSEKQQKLLDEMDNKDMELAKTKELHRIEVSKDKVTRRKMLDEMKKSRDADLKAQKLKFKKLLAEQIKQERQRTEQLIAKQQLEIKEKEVQFKQQIAELSDEHALQNKTFKVSCEREKELLVVKMAQMEELMIETESKYKEEHAEMMKVIEKKNYECHYPIPDSIADLYASHPNCFAIQVLGGRGVGKSTFINKILQRAGIDAQANTDSNECTKMTESFRITEKVSNMPDRYNEILIVDQPGIGGLDVNEAGYLATFGPGHFNFTFLLADSGFNELELNILKHLQHNKKPLAFVRTKCDAAINGILDNKDSMNFEDAFQELKSRFETFINDKVRSKVEKLDLDIYYTGIRQKSYPDWERLFDYILSGRLVEQIGRFEPNVNHFLS